MTNASIGQSVFIILIFTILIIINIVYIHINALKSHWSQYKCTQWAAYLAPMLGEDTTTSFEECVTTIQNTNNTLHATQQQSQKDLQFATLQSANNAHTASAATSAGITSNQVKSLQQATSEQSLNEISAIEYEYVKPNINNLSSTQIKYLQNFFFNILPNIFKAPGGDWLGLKPVYEALKNINSIWKAFISI